MKSQKRVKIRNRSTLRRSRIKRSRRRKSHKLQYQKSQNHKKSQKGSGPMWTKKYELNVNQVKAVSDKNIKNISNKKLLATLERGLSSSNKSIIEDIKSQIEKKRKETNKDKKITLTKLISYNEKNKKKTYNFRSFSKQTNYLTSLVNNSNKLMIKYYD